MTRLKHMSEGDIEMLGPGAPQTGYLREKIHEVGAAGFVAFAGGLAIGLGYTILHPEQTDNLAQSVRDWWVNTIG